MIAADDNECFLVNLDDLYFSYQLLETISRYKLFNNCEPIQIV